MQYRVKLSYQKTIDMKRLYLLSVLFLLTGATSLVHAQVVASAPKARRSAMKSMRLFEMGSYSHAKHLLSTYIERGWRYWEAPNSNYDWKKFSYYYSFKNKNSEDEIIENIIDISLDIIDAYNKIDDYKLNLTDTIMPNLETIFKPQNKDITTFAFCKPIDCAMLKLPIGIQSLASLRSDGFAYVDKSRLVYDLTQNGKYIFLSRPRSEAKFLQPPVATQHGNRKAVED